MSSQILNQFPEVVRQSNLVCGQFFEKKCCHKLIYDLDIYDEECIKLFVTKSLGYGIIVLGSAVKLPQVFKILSAKSGTGLSLFGVLLELMAITFNSCYSFRNNFPFSAWGESVFLAIETALIAFLILWYDDRKFTALNFIGTYIGAVHVMLNPGYVSSSIMWWLQSSVLYLAVSGKLIQAYKNYQAKHTGQISALTAWAIFLGSFVRIFTTIRETGDKLATITFICTTLANGVIALQVLWFWKSTQAFLEKGRKKKNE